MMRRIRPPMSSTSIASRYAPRSANRSAASDERTANEQTHALLPIIIEVDRHGRQARPQWARQATRTEVGPPAQGHRLVFFDNRSLLMVIRARRAVKVARDIA
ncbi:MAG TPA: hypothetical protein VEL07_23590 [Planctomycetota bacterium]|nr:hypothetical protein [Planctomycetota bacterium]